MDGLDKRPCVVNQRLWMGLPQLLHLFAQRDPRRLRQIRHGQRRCAVGQAKHVERPTATAHLCLCKAHVHRIYVRMLFAIYLHAHKRMHRLCHLLKGKALLCHHMAPVAGGISNGNEQQPVPFPGLAQRVFAIRHPAHGIVRMLLQIRGSLMDQLVVQIAILLFCIKSSVLACPVCRARTRPCAVDGKKNLVKRHLPGKIGMTFYARFLPFSPNVWYIESTVCSGF